MASWRKARRVAVGTRRMSDASVLIGTRKPSAVDPVPGVVSGSFQSMNRGVMPDPCTASLDRPRRRCGAADVDRPGRTLLAILRRRLGAVGGVRVVFGQSRDQLAANQRLQV